MSRTISAIHHISYANHRFRLAAGLLTRSARKFGLRSQTYGPADPVVRDLFDKYPDIMRHERGGGYWLWKPFIIRDALANVPEGDLVLYTDAGMVFVSDPRSLCTVALEHPIALFEEIPSVPLRLNTKRDCFVLLDADTRDYWDTPQLWAGFQLYRSGKEAKSFVDAVCAAIANANVLTDLPNISGLPDFPDFVMHRWDQSVLTIVARKHAIPLFPDPSQYGLRAPRAQQMTDDDGIVRPGAPYGQVVHSHRKQNRNLPTWYIKWRLGHYARRGWK